MSQAIRVLIADDEAPARRKIGSLLAADQRFEIAGEARDGDETVAQIEALRPDLVFLDIQMPRKTGFEVIEAIGTDNFPAVIFSTAYDAYALKAFEVNAIDYLLKPFEPERFRQSLKRALTRNDQPDAHQASLAALVEHIRKPFLRRILIRSGKRMVPLEVDQISHITSEDKYVMLHHRGESYLHRESLRALEDKLDPTTFVRVHRSTIVNIGHIAELTPWSHGDYRIVLRDGNKLTLSRTYRDNFMSRMG